MTRFFTSDQHFGHANILKYEDERRRNACGGRFQSISEHDDFIIDQWNAVVSSDDTVYCLGDFSYKQGAMEAVLPFMNGWKILICGNHDPYIKRLTLPRTTKMYREAFEDALRAGFSELHLELDMKIEGIGQVRLSHFPFLPADTTGLPEYELRNREIRPSPDGVALLLHGHVHSQWKSLNNKEQPPMLNVGVDVWGMRPVSEAQIVSYYRDNLAIG